MRKNNGAFKGVGRPSEINQLSRRGQASQARAAMIGAHQSECLEAQKKWPKL